MKTIKLPIENIVIELGDEDIESPTRSYKGGTIKGNIDRYVCHFCEQQDCCYDCGESFSEVEVGRKSEINGVWNDHYQQVAERLKFNGAMDAIESFLLALAIAGINVESPAVLEALETTILAAGENIEV